MLYRAAAVLVLISSLCYIVRPHPLNMHTRARRAHLAHGRCSLAHRPASAFAYPRICLQHDACARAAVRRSVDHWRTCRQRLTGARCWRGGRGRPRPMPSSTARGGCQRGPRVKISLGGSEVHSRGLGAEQGHLNGRIGRVLHTRLPPRHSGCAESPLDEDQIGAWAAASRPPPAVYRRRWHWQSQ